MSPRIHVQIETTADEAEIEKKAAAANAEYEIASITPLRRGPDSPLVEARFVDPVTVAATATLALTAVRLVNHWLKSDERGVQIDLRTQPATISQLRNVPAGVMVIIDRTERRRSAGKPTANRKIYCPP
jgi:hypothetical protein